MSMLKSILHPTDFSAESAYAFQVACSLAKDNGARLILLHVILPSVSPLMEEAMPNPLEPAELQDALGGKYSWPQPTDPNLSVEHRVAEGDAVEEILRLADTLHCDLIVMGTHGRTGWNRLLAGSVAEGVVRQAACPVMTVKNPPAEPGTLPAPVKYLANPGEIVDVRPLGSALPPSGVTKLAGSLGVDMSRLVVPAGKEIFQTKSRGTLILQCLEGRVSVTAFGRTRLLEAGQLLFLSKDEPYTLIGIENSSLLVTTVLSV